MGGSDDHSVVDFVFIAFLYKNMYYGPLNQLIDTLLMRSHNKHVYDPSTETTP